MVLILARYLPAKLPITEKQLVCQAECAMKTACKWLATWRIREFSSPLATSMDVEPCRSVGILSIGLDEPRTPTPWIAEPKAKIGGGKPIIKEKFSRSGPIVKISSLQNILASAQNRLSASPRALFAPADSR